MTESVVTGKQKPTKPSVWKSFNQPAAWTMFFFGFTSGLPFLLVGGTLSAWLKESGLSLTSIGFFSLAGLAYSFKFLWAPAVDRVRLPILGRLGQRRSWLLLSQMALMSALILMAQRTPCGGLNAFAILTVFAAFAGATQDTVVDAYRVEIAPAESQGALAATYTLGYRFALMMSGAIALFMAESVPWPRVYMTMAFILLIPMLVVLFSKEPENQIARSANTKNAFREGVIGPFSDFFKRYAGWLGLGLLFFIGWFKISDQMIGVMAIPFYLDSGFTKADIAVVSKLFGVIVGIAGAFLGAASVVKLGAQRSLIIGIIIGAVSNLLFVLLSLDFSQELIASYRLFNPFVWSWIDMQVTEKLLVFIGVICGENLSGGFLGTAAVAWLSMLVSKQYTATQYALFSSLVVLPGKLLGGFSGLMVEGGDLNLPTFQGINWSAPFFADSSATVCVNGIVQTQANASEAVSFLHWGSITLGHLSGMGYTGFFIFSTIAVLPALLVFLWLRTKVNLASSS